MKIKLYVNFLLCKELNTHFLLCKELIRTYTIKIPEALGKLLLPTTADTIF